MSVKGMERLVKSRGEELHCFKNSIFIFDALLERTRFAVPELLELNASEAQSYFLTFKSERHERMAL